MSDVPDYSRGEPAPIPNSSTPIHLLVRDEVLQSGLWDTDSRIQLALLMDERMAYGQKKYGTYLQAHNGRDPLNDLIEEMLDALVYARQCIVEKRAGNKIFMADHYRELMAITLNLLALRDANRADSNNSQGSAHGSAVDDNSSTDETLR